MKKIIEDIEECSECRAEETDKGVLLLAECILQLYPHWFDGADSVTISVRVEDTAGKKRHFNVTFCQTTDEVET